MCEQHIIQFLHIWTHSYINLHAFYRQLFLWDVTKIQQCSSFVVWLIISIQELCSPSCREQPASVEAAFPAVVPKTREIKQSASLLSLCRDLKRTWHCQGWFQPVPGTAATAQQGFEPSLGNSSGSSQLWHLHRGTAGGVTQPFYYFSFPYLLSFLYWKGSYTKSGEGLFESR